MQTKKTTKSALDFLKAREQAKNTWTSISHRLEHVKQHNNIDYVNDSKAMDIDSTYFSLEQIRQPIVWLVGSPELEENYTVFEKLCRYKVINIVQFGETSHLIQSQLGNYVDKFASFERLEDALKQANKWATKGSAVLFSPATPGFDRYNDFRDRGDHFKKLVNNL